jgi:hypothetical protein
MSTDEFAKQKEKQTFLGLFLGPIVWFLHLNTLNMLTSISCRWGWFPFTVVGMPGLRFVEVIISLVFLAVMLYLTYLPWQNWQSYQSREPVRNPQLLQDTEEDRRPLLAFVAMLMNAILTLFVLASFVLLFALKACGQH